MSRRKRLVAASGISRGASKQPGKALEGLELRRMLAAHIVGSSTVYSTIQAAVDAAVAGQTITVDSGTYPEQVSVFKQLTIKGAQAGVDGRSNARGTGESILTGAPATGGLFTSSFKIGANDVTIDGFTVQGENTAASDTGAGIVINPNISGTHIINDIVQNNSTGLYLANASASDPALIQHNVFRNNNNGATETNNGGRGIYTDGSISGGTLQNVTIDGNFFTLNLGPSTFPYQAAIGLEGASTSVTKNINVTNNVFDHNGKAVLALNVTGLLIDSNVVGNEYDTDSGSVRFEGNDHNVTITHNNLYGNGAHAIRIDAKGTPGSDDGFVITNNNIYDNGLEESGIAIQMVAGQYTGTLNATNNYWGSSSGPSGTGFSGTGDGITTDTVSVNVSPWLSTYAVNPEVPYYGVASTVTSNINAVDFDHGLDGVAYHDTTSSNSGNQYRPNVDVDINTTTDPGSGYEVTNTASGEWLRYTVNAATTGVYTLSARVQSTSSGAKFHFEIDGTAVSSSMTIPSSATWQTITQSGITLPAGTHVLRLVFDSNNSSGNAGNWNWFSFALNSAITPPAAPANLVASAISGSQINLNWSDVANETGFKIERSADGSTGWVQIGTIGAGVTTYSDTTVAPFTPYFYRVRATNTAGDSGYSNTASVTSLNTSTSTLIPPGATWKYLDNGTNQGTAWDALGFNDSSWKSGPAELGYGDGDEATVVSYGSDANNKYITTYFRDSFSVSNPASISALNLALVRDDGAVVYLNGTEVFRSNMPTGTITYTTLASTNVGGTDESTFFPGTISPSLLVAGTNVIAVEIHQSVANSSDISFNFSLTASATQPSAPPIAPSNLVATAISYSQINLTWTDNSSNETGFVLQRSPSGANTWTTIATPGINITSYSDATGLAGSTAYDYRIRSTDSAGDSANSNIATVTTPAPPVLPVAPTNLVASALSSSQVVLNWMDNSNNETSFILERSLDGTTNWTQIGTPAANATTFTDAAGLSASTQYFYRIRAVSTAGPSGNSNVANATTLASSTTLPSPWADGDIGTVGTAGSGAYSSGVYTVKGAGSDIWNAADNFNFTYVPLSGDGSITAQVTGLTNTEQWAKAGVMIRQSLTAGAAEASMVITPSNGSVFIYRTATAGSSTGVFSNGVAPYWVRLVRSGTTFTAFISPDGTTWTTVGTQTIAMGTTAYIGLAVASRVTGLATATFSNVTMTGTLPGAPAKVTIAAVSTTQINLTWTDVVGETGFKIERSTDNVNFTQIATTPTGVTSYSDITASGSAIYYYRIKATNASGDSLPSAVVSSQTIQPPAAPTNLVAANAGLTQINLTWTDNSNNETGFKVERSLDGATNWISLATTAPNVTSYNDTNLPADTKYFYRVRSTGAGGDSTNATASATTAPAAPSNVAATSFPNALQINLIWTDNSTTETGFTIERSPNGTDTWTSVGATAANATSFNDASAGLAPGTAYFYRVRANSAAGDSANSNVATATTSSAPAAPTNLVAVASTSALQINLTWTDNAGNETGFIIERSPDGSTNWTQVGAPAANAISFSDTTPGLVVNTAYFYRVRAANAALGNSSNSNVASATTAAAPVAPGNLVAAGASTSEIDLTWTDNASNETGFIIERSPNGTGTWTPAGTAPANATTFNDTGLTPGSPYFYRVRATNNGLDSANTTIAHSWPLAGVPAAPTPNGVALNTLPVTLDWADALNATSYDVYWGNTLLGNVTSSQYTGVIPASADGTQVWHVIAKNADNSTAGPQWSFTLDTVAPTATYGNQTPTPETSSFDFTVNYADIGAGINAATFDNNDITVTGPNGYSANATFISAAGNIATYRIAAPGGTWDVINDGVYTISQNTNQVLDNAGNATPAGAIGTFTTNSFAYLSGTNLNIHFDGTTMPVTLGISGGALTVTKGDTTLTFNSVSSIVAVGSDGGNDQLLIDGSVASPLTFSNPSGNDSVEVVAGNYNFTSDLSPSLRNVTVTIDAGASASFNSSQHLANLIVNGTVTLAPGGGNILFTNALTVAGKLNLSDNALFIDYSGASQAGSATGGIYNGITGLVQSGRSGGTWTGNGIVTGMSAAAGSNPLTTLGVAEASDALGITGSQTALWNGQTVDATTVLVKYTYLGDANLDGIINGDDYFLIDQGYATQTSGYAHGDFDYNGRIDADDYFAIDSHYFKATTPLAPSLAIQQDAPAVATPATVSNGSIFSDSSITSAYDRLSESDELL